MRFPGVVLVAVALLGPAATAEAALRWERVDAPRSPSARHGHSMAAADSRSVYLFGGRSEAGRPLADLWHFDTRARRWRRVEPKGARPPARFGANLVTEFPGTLILFGGQAGGDFFDDVWRYHAGANTWVRLGAMGPSPRYGAGAAGDPVTGAVYVTHGFTDMGRFDDTWSLSDGRFAAASSGPAPPARCLVHAAFHDGRLFLFGGQSNPRPFLNDLWRLDLESGLWRQLRPSTAPTARNLYAAWTTGRFWWIHGGNAAAGPRGELWRLDMARSRFRRITPRGRRPAARFDHAGAAAGRVTVMFGGAGAAGDLRDTWLLRR